MIFRKSSYPVGISKVQTLHALMQQIERQTVELLDDIASESRSISLNKMLIQKVKPSLTMLNEMIKEIEKQKEQDDASTI